MHGMQTAISKVKILVQVIILLVEEIWALANPLKLFRAIIYGFS
jgi:hypothetical protein